MDDLSLHDGQRRDAPTDNIQKWDEKVWQWAQKLDLWTTDKGKWTWFANGNEWAAALDHALATAKFPRWELEIREDPACQSNHQMRKVIMDVNCRTWSATKPGRSRPKTTIPQTGHR